MAARAAGGLRSTLGTASAGADGYDVILLVGQSNMHGRGTPVGPATDPEHPLIEQLLDGETVVPAVEPLGNTGADGMGPGLQFARWYVAEGLNQDRKVLLINAAQGGTPLTRDAAPTWKPSFAGSLFDRAVSWTKAALTRPGARLVAILWLQGETDGDLRASGTEYQTQLDDLIAGLRSTFDTPTPTVPFILGQMVPDYLGTGTREEINAVHADTPHRHAYVGFAASPLDSHLDDGNHFNADGQRIIGRNMFEVYRTVRAGLGGSMTPTIVP